MKKLIALVAIATCGAALAVESANIVGYMSKDMATAGYYNYTPMFVGVDGSNPAVKDIVPSTSDTTVEDLGEAKINLFVLDTSRKFAKTFAYKTVDGDWMDVDGWYFGDEEEPTDYTLGPGESLQVMAPYQLTLTMAGAVDQGAYDFTAPAAGYYMIGNQHATNMPLNDIVPSTSDPTVEDLGEAKINLFVLDTSRKFAKTFSYKTEDGDWMDEDGWYFGDEEEPTNYELAPGEVLQFLAPYQVKLSFPDQSL